MTEVFSLQRRLGYRILRWVLSAAIIAGSILSVVQIVSDARYVSSELDRDARETLELVREASTQAIFSLDEALGSQVISGLSVSRNFTKPPSPTLMAKRWHRISDRLSTPATGILPTGSSTRPGPTPPNCIETISYPAEGQWFTASFVSPTTLHLQPLPGSNVQH